METTDKNKAKGDRIVVDSSNLSELKATCDEAVERVSCQAPQVTIRGRRGIDITLPLFTLHRSYRSSQMMSPWQKLKRLRPSR